MIVTISDVAKAAGVSTATVSRVINQSGRVSPVTLEKVNQAMAQMGYRPNTAAQSLASNRSNCLGMVVSWLDSPFYGPVMAAAEDATRPLNKHLLIASAHGSEAKEKDAVDYLISRGVDGLILATERLSEDYLVALSRRIPIYIVNHHIDSLKSRCSFIDNELGSYMATRHLLELGHRKIICTAGDKFKQDARERVQGYIRAMSEFGIQVKDSWIDHQPFELNGGFQAIKNIHQRGVKFTAVVAGNDEQAFGVMEYIYSLGLSVPGDVSVMGFDNIQTAFYMRPKLSTIAVPIYEMAKTATIKCLNESYQQNIPEPILPELQLIERESVASLSRVDAHNAITL